MCINSEYCLRWLIWQQTSLFPSCLHTWTNANWRRAVKWLKIHKLWALLGVYNCKMKKLKANNTVLINYQILFSIKCPFKKVELYKRNILKTVWSPYWLKVSPCIKAFHLQSYQNHIRFEDHSLEFLHDNLWHYLLFVYLTTCHAYRKSVSNSFQIKRILGFKKTKKKVIA